MWVIFSGSTEVKVLLALHLRRSPILTNEADR